MVMGMPCVYMMASRRGGTLYIGSTWDLARRVWEHKRRFVEGFSKDYGVDRLVWYEEHESMESAQARERAMKKWYRAWKVRLVEEGNPRWEDLYGEVLKG